MKKAPRLRGLFILARAMHSDAAKMKRTRTKWPDRLTWTASFAFAALFFAPPVLADETTESEKELPTLTPNYPNEKPTWGTTSKSSTEPQNEAPTKPGWYGREVIGVTAAFDVMSVLGMPAFFAIDSIFGGGLVVTGMVGRSLSGPIIHRVHGQSWGHVAKSYALEVTGDLVGVGTAFVFVSQCPGLVGADHLPPQPTLCGARTAFPIMIAVPLALSITGTILDSVYLAHDKPNATTKTALPGFTLAPYIVPSFQRDERTGKENFGMQFGFGGTF